MYHQILTVLHVLWGYYNTNLAKHTSEKDALPRNKTIHYVRVTRVNVILLSLFARRIVQKVWVAAMHVFITDSK